MMSKTRFDGWFWACLLLAVLATALVGRHLIALLGLPSADRVVGAPFTAHGVLGTDYLGRDVAARALVGGSHLVVVPMVVATVSVVTSALLGVVLAWPGGLQWGIRLISDVVLVIPPAVLVLVVVTGTGIGLPGLVALMVAVAVPFSSRYFAALATEIADRGFVECALAAGDSRFRVALREVLPCMLPALASEVGVRWMSSVQLLAVVAFLGGASGPGLDTASWPIAVQRNASGIVLNPWAVLVPAIFIAGLTVPVAILADRRAQR